MSAAIINYPSSFKPFLSNLFARVCQPFSSGSFKALRTSESSRIVTRSFGSSDLGRPGLLFSFDCSFVSILVLPSTFCLHQAFNVRTIIICHKIFVHTKIKLTAVSAFASVGLEASKPHVHSGNRTRQFAVFLCPVFGGNLAYGGRAADTTPFGERSSPDLCTGFEPPATRLVVESLLGGGCLTANTEGDTMTEKQQSESLYFLTNDQLEGLRDCIRRFNDITLSLPIVIEALEVNADFREEAPIQLENSIANLQILQESLEHASKLAKDIMIDITAQSAGELSNQSTQSE
ncbi:hypothetical protein [Kiloniella sp. b19]|uniref:hypothetical protein n=1 Tax=Kiloniella sp. GXU_MW_B19 TaxID=3141326 RepID=UPI0031DCC8FB